MAAIGTRPITAPGWTGQPRTDVAIVDCDVHHSLTKNEDLLPYLSRVYQERITDYGFLLPGSGYFNAPKRAVRPDLADGCDVNGEAARKRGTSYESLRDVHLDVWNVDYAILTGGNMYAAGVIPDPEYASALCRAFNDWTLENWIAKDRRFKMTMAVATSDPRLADETLIYCSDWPHWDWDDPATTFPRLPETLHRRIFADNARELFNL